MNTSEAVKRLSIKLADDPELFEFVVLTLLEGKQSEKQPAKVKVSDWYLSGSDRCPEVNQMGCC
jgi:hypothetical protein